MLHALVFYPDLGDPELDAFRRRHDPYFELIPEHVTVVHPIPAETLAREALVEHVRRVLASWSPFDARFRAPEKSWDHWLLLPARQGNGAFLRLRGDLYGGPLTACVRSDLEYRPALGLGLFASGDYDPLDPTPSELDEKRFTEAAGEAARLGFDYRCTVSSLTLIGLGEPLGRREDLVSFPLAG